MKSKTPGSRNIRILMIHTQQLSKACSLSTRGWGGLSDITVPLLPLLGACSGISLVHAEHKSTETDTQTGLRRWVQCAALAVICKGEPVRDVTALAIAFRHRGIHHATQASCPFLANRYLFYL